MNKIYDKMNDELSLIRKNTLYNGYYRDHDISDIYSTVYNFINENIELGIGKLDSILDRFMNKSDVEDIISSRIQNDGLYVIDRIKNVDLNCEYFKFDGYEDLENIDYIDVIDRIDDILSEIYRIIESKRMDELISK